MVSDINEGPVAHPAMNGMYNRAIAQMRRYDLFFIEKISECIVVVTRLVSLVDLKDDPEGVEFTRELFFDLTNTRY